MYSSGEGTVGLSIQYTGGRGSHSGAKGFSNGLKNALITSRKVRKAFVTFSADEVDRDRAGTLGKCLVAPARPKCA